MGVQTPELNRAPMCWGLWARFLGAGRLEWDPSHDERPCCTGPKSIQPLTTRLKTTPPKMKINKPLGLVGRFCFAEANRNIDKDMELKGDQSPCLHRSPAP